ncbi:ABC transporter permease [Mangrovicoccus algicola]|uniref:Transport permease protein n=1 Tax=Mangrovicoccus algicola TaxID=2771008 RepID=A0A8J6YWQ4_9RHOB|nr:ABC transporter permease [Mangrovicoccus algicola]MBE3639007.1 ABC transporter permease [Mangrovicoccus algicola]
MGLLNAFARTPRVVGALMLREMATTYGKSPGGYIWAVLEPLGGILMMAICFSLFMRTPPIGDNFMLFYASGILPFSIYMDLSNKVSGSISFSRALLAYPSVTFMDAILARLLLNSLMQFLVFYIVLGGIVLVYQPDLIPDASQVALALALILLLSFGMGTLNCFLFAMYPLYKQIWSIATRPLLLASGIFFTYHSLPPMLQSVLWYNPILQIVGVMRDGIYYQYDGAYISVTYVLLFSIVPMLLGLFFLSRYYRVILYEK